MCCGFEVESNIWQCRKWCSCVEAAMHIGKTVIVYVTSSDKVAFRTKQCTPGKQGIQLENK
jgi:hypothetical protein